MVNIDINLDEMDRAVTLLNNTAENLSSLKTNINKATTTLLTSWKGESKVAFEAEYDILKVHLGEYNELLGDMADSLKKIRDSFSDADIKLSKNMIKE